MRNNNYLSLINFKVKLHFQRLFFLINEHEVGGSNSFIYKGDSLRYQLNFDLRLLWDKI